MLRTPRNRRTVVLATAVVSVALLHPFGQVRAAPVQQAPSVTGDALAALAATEIATAQETHYTYHSHIDHTAGIYDTDCSGFVDDLLQQVAPDAYAAVPAEQGFSGPRAYMFERFFAALPADGELDGWQAVLQLPDAQPGDVLAWELEPLTPDHDTGHVLVIAAAPQPNADGTFSVGVSDASTIRHQDDSRAPGTNGIGSGTITFRVNGDGVPTEFRFDTHDHFHSVPIAIARLVDNG